MLAKESAAATFDLPEEVLAVLPSDPYEQLDVARKITSMALLTRVSSLESESSGLCAKLVEKDHSIAGLQFQVESLDASLTDALDKLSRSELEKEKLVKENEWLTSQLTFKTLLHGSMNAETQTDILLCCRNKSDRNTPRMFPARTRKSSSGCRRIDEFRVDLRSTQEESI